MKVVDLGAVAFFYLLVAGLAYGAGSMFFFRRFSNFEMLKASRQKLLAHLMEFRLFPSEPRLILRAQLGVLAANAGLLQAIAKPLLPLTGFFVLTSLGGTMLFERAPLTPGEPAVVTAHFRQALPAAHLSVPDWLTVRTPPVRVLHEREISWGVRPLRTGSGKLHLRWSTGYVDYPVYAGFGLHWLHPPNYPREAALDVQYPAATVLGLNWLTIFFTAACLGAIGSATGFRRDRGFR